MILLKILAVVLAVFLFLALVKGPREAWRLWRRFGAALGDWIARLVLTLFYFSVLVPFALIAMASRDALGRKRPEGAGLWGDGQALSQDLESAGRQF